MEQQNGKRETWGSSLGFVLAAAGSAVGLGNIWKFPYITGENGGGAFVLIYLLCITAIGLPVMLCEFVMGRRTRRNPVGAFRALAPGASTLAHLLGAALLFMGAAALVMRMAQLGKSGAAGAPMLEALAGWGWPALFIALGLCVFRWGWRIVGAMGVLAGFSILCFYSVVSGWTLGYLFGSLSGRQTLTLEAQRPPILAAVLLDRLRAPPEGLEADLRRAGLPPDAIQRELQAASRRQLAEALASLPGGQVPSDAAPADALAESFLKAAEACPPADLAARVRAAYGWRGQEVGSALTGRTGAPGALLTAVAGQRFGAFIGNPWLAIGCHFLAMLATIVIVALGVRRGIEWASKILMPTLVLLLLVLIVRALTLPGAGEGIRFYLTPDFTRLNTESVLKALGHAFFSLSLGMGAMITYGSYAERDENLFTTALAITGADTAIALMAGLMIFPAVFAEGFTPGMGPGLVFNVLPAVFHRMALGPLWASLFFLLLFIAALTSAISLLEVVTAYFVDERGWGRVRATLTFGTAIFAVGCLCAVSVGDWARLRWLGDAIGWVFAGNRASFFDLMDNMASNWMLPLGGLFICLFVGWVWGTKAAVDEIRHGSANFADVHLVSLLAGLKDDPSHNAPVHVVTLASLWGIFIRFISPVAVLVAFLYTIGWIEFAKRPPPAPPPTEQTQPARN